MSIVQKIQRVKRAMDYIWLRMMHSFLKPIAQMVYGGKHIWIISERGTDARDNGYHMYRFIRENHPEQRAYYIIEKKSADYPKVAVYGNVVERGTLKHWLLYLGAEVRISTHNNGFLPTGLFPMENWHFRRFVSQRKNKEKIVFLQHGVTKDDLKGLYKENTNFSLFICGAKPEYDYILSRFGYSKEEVKYTGFARFDGLHRFAVKRQVLIMPTWRQWLSTSFSSATIQNVENSVYLQKWTAFLKNKQLSRLAQQHQIKFIFYPHYEIQPYLHLFEQKSDHIVIADFAHYDVQQLLKESMLLITDYSSVFFDFAYMQKPVLYYQFDEDEYRAHHYEQGYFDYRRDGFGEVVTEESELLNCVEQYLGDDCRLKPVYQKRIEGFFPLHDDKNCERIYHEIVQLCKKQ